MTDIESLLEESVKLHGHLCPGQVIGVRMASVGLRAINISDPKGADRKNLIVFVEMDRCATNNLWSLCAWLYCIWDSIFPWHLAFDINHTLRKALVYLKIPFTIISIASSGVKPCAIRVSI
jgi:hypothetical protein